jgi:ribosomal protein L16/L10AE
LNLNFLIKKNHIFKRRKKKIITSYNKPNLNSGIYNLNLFRFEFIYLKVFKKIFRKKYLKKKPMYNISKFWLMIKPNFLLTMKSKNSRMGSGVGSYVRVCSILKPNTPIVLFKNYSKYFLKQVVIYIKLKLGINTLVRYVKFV